MPLPNLLDSKNKTSKKSTTNDDVFMQDFMSMKEPVTQPLPSAPAKEEQGAIGDIVDKFQEGFYSTTGSTMTGLRGMFTDTQEPWDIEQSQYDAAARQQDTLSTAQKEADVKMGFDPEDEITLKGTTGLVASGLGSLLPSMIGGGVPGAVLKTGAKVAGAGAVAQKAAQGAGYAAGGAVQIGGATKNEVEEEIGRMSPDNLMMMPDFKALLDSGIPFEQARKQFSYDQSQKGLTQGGILGAVSMGTLGPVLERIVMGSLGKTAIQKIMGGAGTEGVQEFIEEGGQARITNPLLGKEDWEGVVERGGLGAIGGMGAGGVAGAAGAMIPQPRSPDDIPIKDDQGNIVGYQDQKTGEKYSPIDMAQGGPLPMSPVGGQEDATEIQTPRFGRGGDEILTPGFGRGGEQPSTIQNPTDNKVVPDTGSLSNALNASSVTLPSAPSLPEAGKDVTEYEAPLEGEVMGGELATKGAQPELELDAIEGEFTTLQDGEQKIQMALEQGLIGPEDANNSFQYIETRRTELNDQLKEYQNRVAQQNKLDKKARPMGPFEQPSSVVGQNERGEDIYQDEEGKRFLKGVEGTGKGQNKQYEMGTFRGARFQTPDEIQIDQKRKDELRTQKDKKPVELTELPEDAKGKDVEESLWKLGIAKGRGSLADQKQKHKTATEAFNSIQDISSEQLIKKSKTELQKLATDLKLPKTGNKDTLVDKLLEHANLVQHRQDKTKGDLVTDDRQRQVILDNAGFKIPIAADRGWTDLHDKMIEVGNRLHDDQRSDADVQELKSLISDFNARRKAETEVEIAETSAEKKAEEVKTFADKQASWEKINAEFEGINDVDELITKAVSDGIYDETFTDELKAKGDIDKIRSMIQGQARVKAIDPKGYKAPKSKPTTKEVPTETELVDEKPKPRLTVDIFKNPKGADRVKVTGDTFALKDEIKAIGGASWSRKFKAWTFPISKEGAVRAFVNALDVKTEQDIVNERLEKAGQPGKFEDVTEIVEKDAQGRTEKQLEAGNYKKIHKQWNGLDIAIENAEGTIRSGSDEDGKAWEVTMENDYGYIKRTKGADGDHVDVFMGPNLTSDKVYVVNQSNPDGSFDEHKVMVGFNSKEGAEKGYLANYEQGWSNYDNLAETTVEGFKTWIDKGDQKKAAKFEKYEGGGKSKAVKEFLRGERKDPPTIEEVAAEEKPKTYGKENKIFTEDAADSARELLKKKFGQLNVGIDPEILQAGLTLAGYHIEAGARQFTAFSKTMINDLGNGVEPYLRSWYESVRHYPGFDNKGMSTAAEIEAVPAQDIEETLAGKFDNVKTNRDLRALTENGTDLELKAIQEEYETYIVQKAMDIVQEKGTEKETFDKLVDLYNNQVNMDVRTSTSKEMQAYSTPAPLAYIASKLADIDINTVVYEPTAGNGMLLLDSNKEYALANELDPNRAENLRKLGFNVKENNAVTFKPKGRIDAIVANPPFGNVQGETKIDHLITLNSLEALSDKGKATIIIGANKEPGISSGERNFFNELYSKYNVTDIFEISGKLYSRSGAAWPIRVITIDGKLGKDEKFTSPESKNIKRLNSWEEIYDRYQSNDRTEGRKVTTTDPRSLFGKQEDTVQPDRVGPVTGEDKQGTGTRAGRGPDTGTTVTGGPGGTGIGPTRADSGRVDAGQRKLEPTPEPDTGTTKTSTKGTAADTKKPKPRGRDSLDKQSEYQSDYPVSSKGFNEAVLVPNNMLEPLKKALKKLKKEVGDLDNYVADKLQYESNEAMHKAFMGLQVDAVAAAIYNIDNGNKGIIIADQTGVGKGRQAAAILRYAKLTGRTPVFVTVGDNLFSDMYADLLEIDEKGIKPFIFNDKSVITHKKKVVQKAHTGPKRTQALKDIIDGKGLPEGHNAIFTTYSQFNLPTGKQRPALENVDNPIFVFDESHNAAGERTKKKKIDGKWEQVNLRAGYLFNLIKNKPTIYLSATYAKRPDNTAIYHRTDMMDAVDTPEDLIAAVEAGGIPLQTILSGMLAESGQLFRRERSFKGISFNQKIIKENMGKQIKDFNALAEGLTSVDSADGAYQKLVYPGLADLAEEQGIQTVVGGNKASDTVGMPNSFASILHNYSSQFTMAAKADLLVDEVLNAVKTEKKVKYLDGTVKTENQKAFIGLENTMEAGIKGIVEHNKLKPGDDFPYSFKDILINALNKTRYINIKDPKTNNIVDRIQISLQQIRDISPLAYQIYKRAESDIKNLNISDIPVSPIDYVLQKLNDAGVKTGEMTGRGYGVDYSGDVPKVKMFGKRNKNKTITDYNTGEIDVILANTSGSTGFSIHSSEKPEVTDKRQRHMFVVQAPKDINILVQMLGRINRTGQVVLPEYTMLSLNVPAETRAAIMTAKKMSSLNANTSANEESDLSLKIPDFINKYGNAIANNFLLDNMDIALKLKLSGKLKEDVDITEGLGDKLMTQLTGKLVLMDVETQNYVLEEMSSQYNELIDMLNANGTNDLIVQDVNLEAKILESRVIHEGNGTSIFDQDSVLHTVDANFVGNYLKESTVQKELDKDQREDVIENAGKDETTYNKLEKKLEDARSKEYKDNNEKEKAIDEIVSQMNTYNTVKARTTALVKSHQPGTLLLFSNGDKGVVVGISHKHTEGKGNPYSPSKVKLKVAVNNGIGMVNTSLSLISSKSTASGTASNLDRIFIKPLGKKQERKVATGNLLMGITKLEGGKVVTFTDDQGKRHQGILMPKDSVVAENQTFKAEDPKVLQKFLEDGGRASSNDNKIKVAIRSGYLIINLPSTDKSPIVKKVKYDKGLRQLMGKDFAGKGSFMNVTVDKNIPKVIKYLMDIASLNIPTSERETWVKLGGKEEKQAKSKFTDDDLSAVTKKSPVEHEDFSFTGVTKPAGLSERSILAIINDIYGRPLRGSSKFKNLNIINDKNEMWRGKFSPTTKKVTLNAYYLSKEDAVRVLHHEKIHQYIKTHTGLKKVGDKILARAKKYPNSAAGKALEIAKRRVPKKADQYERRVYEETLAYLIQFYNKPGHSSTLKEFINTIRKFFANNFGMFMNESDAVDYVAKMVKAESVAYQDVPVLTKQVKEGGKADYSAMPKSITNKINALIKEEKTLSDKVDKAYKAGRLVIAQKLDAELAETRENLDSVVSQAESDYELADDTTEFVQSEDIETSQDEDLINIWGNYKRKHGYAAGNKEELIMLARGAMNNNTSLSDNEVFKMVKEAGERQESIIKAHKDAVEDYSALDDTAGPDIRNKVNQGRDKDTMGEMYGKFKENLTNKMRQGLIDRYNQLFVNDKKLYGDDILASKENFSLSAWQLAKSSTSSQGSVHGMIDYGRIMMDKNGALDIRPGKQKSIVEVLKQLGSGSEINDFMTWIAANRGERLYLEGWNPTKGPKSQYQGGRENLFTWEEIQQGKAFNKGKEKLWNDVLKEFDQFRKDVLQISQKSGIISEQQATDFANEMYVPFYRVMSEDQIAAGAIPGRKDAGRLSRAEAYKKLKGGKEKIGDLLENTLMNYNHLLSASLKNNAASRALKTASHSSVDVAVQVPEKLAVTGKATFIMEDGKKVWYNVDDKLTYNALVSLTDLGMNQGLMKVMRSFKRVFTTATTASPQFITANFMRDSVHAAAIGKKTMSSNAATGFLNFNDKNRNKQRMIASGGAFSFGHIYMDDPDAIKRQIDRDFRKANLLSEPKHIGDMALKMWDRYQEVSNRAENANRMAVYEQALKDDKSHQQAAFEARDLLDFSSRGEWAAIRVLTDIVPFLNARLQGLDVMTRKGIVPTIKTVMGKGTDSDKVIAKRFSIVTGAVMLASMALYMAYKDDEDFKKLEDWQRDTYWFFKIGDHKFFIPKPFEIGAMGTMAERTLEQMVDNKVTGDLFAERFKEMLLTTFAFNPTPQMIKPVYDVYANRDSFTGRSIETQAMRNLSPENRQRGMTTSLAKNTSAALQSLFGGDSGATLSPVQIDFLIKNYLGWVGASASGFVDNLVNTGERPEKYWHEYQPIKRFYQSGESNYSRYTTQFYDNMKEVNRVYADIKHFADLGRLDKARELLSDNKSKLPYRKLMNRVSKKLTAANKQMIKVRRSDLSQADKRRRIDALQQYKNTLTSQFKDI